MTSLTSTTYDAFVNDKITMPVKLRCKLVSDLDSIRSNHETHQKVIVLTPDNDKSTSFSIDSASTKDSIWEQERPCYLVIECFHEGSMRSIPFLFGGMELKSNSRNIESYAIIDDAKDVILNAKNFGNYWQTSQGSKIDSEENDLLGRQWYKTVILAPSSKATSIKHLTLKLLSLQPAKCTKVTISQIKIKCKLPDIRLESDHPVNSHQVEIGESQETSQATLLNVSQTKSNDDQLPCAIRALTTMIESVQTTIQSTIERTTGDIEMKLYAKDRQIFSVVNDIQKGLDDLRTSVDNLTLEVQSLRRQNDIKQYHLDLKAELEAIMIKEREATHCILSDHRKNLLDEFKKQQELVPVEGNADDFFQDDDTSISSSPDPS